MKRISIKDLEAICARINILTGNPATPYTKGKDGKFRANIGNYHLSQAYGGVSLHQMQNEGGGVRDVLGCGHQSKREVYHLMHAFIRGLEVVS